MTNDLPGASREGDGHSSVAQSAGLSSQEPTRANLDRGGLPRPGHFSGTLTLGRQFGAGYILTIIRNTAAKHNVRPDEILGPRRHKQIVAARHEAVRRAYFETRFSSTQLGRIFKRDHSTILYACGLCSSKKPIAVKVPTRLGAMERLAAQN